MNNEENNKEICVVIGHRGTGKTSWVKEVEKYFSQKNQKILIIDTDQEIRNETHQNIAQIFEKGEGHFRKIENAVFKKCIEISKSFNGKVFISLGAGYEGCIPEFCKVIHLKRQSDQIGRILFNRPRILPHLSSFDECYELYLKRELIYERQKDVVFTRLDYFKSFQGWDEVFLGEDKLPFENGVLTLSEKNSPSSQEKLNMFLSQRLKWGFRYFELRDDDISESFFTKTLLSIPAQKIILSFRDKKSSLFTTFLNRNFQHSKHDGDEVEPSCKTSSLKNQAFILDLPLEWGGSPHAEGYEECTRICSLHERKPDQSLNEVLNQFPEKLDAHLKLAVEIFSFEELWQGHMWQKENPHQRSFHPRSAEGRWKWYRLLFGPCQPFYFIREDDKEGVLDQPVMAESVRCEGAEDKGFACVLGDPVNHSATPFEQGLFFRKYNFPVVSILMKKEEANNRNMKILENFGMKFSAVTSPLKKKIYQIFAGSADESCKRNVGFRVLSKNEKNVNTKIKARVSSLNTLIWTPQGWSGWNTDIEGALAFKKYIHQLKLNQTAVWGGGAVRDALDFVFSLNGGLYSSAKDVDPVKSGASCEPIIHAGAGLGDSAWQFHRPSPAKAEIHLSFYSARTGRLLKGSVQNPDVVIWAVGRSRISSCMNPPRHWRPLYIFDVNYTEDSPGREYALETKAQYVSGWLWFKAQAQAQRTLFEKLNNRKDWTS